MWFKKYILIDREAIFLQHCKKKKKKLKARMTKEKREERKIKNEKM